MRRAKSTDSDSELSEFDDGMDVAGEWVVGRGKCGGWCCGCCCCGGWRGLFVVVVRSGMVMASECGGW